MICRTYAHNHRMRGKAHTTRRANTDRLTTKTIIIIMIIIIEEHLTLIHRELIDAGTNKKVLTLKHKPPTPADRLLTPMNKQLILTNKHPTLLPKELMNTDGQTVNTEGLTADKITQRTRRPNTYQYSPEKKESISTDGQTVNTGGQTANTDKKKKNG